MRPEEARALLGTKAGAPASEVRKAYRRRVRRVHPDSSARPNVEMMDRLKEAVEAVVRDTGVRAAREQAAADLRQALASAERIETATLRLTAEELAAGGSFELAVLHAVRCVFCKGSGAADGQVAPDCAMCDGAGIRNLSETVVAACTLCRGAGRAHTAETRCPACFGEGETGRHQRYECRVAPGMKAGELVRVVETHRGALRILLGLADRQETFSGRG